MNKTKKQLQAENEYMRFLLKLCYSAISLAEETEHNEEWPVIDFSLLQEGLGWSLLQAEFDPGELAKGFTCDCDISMKLLMRRYGVGYRTKHIMDCSECGAHTLHTLTPSLVRCLDCGYSASLEEEQRKQEEQKALRPYELEDCPRCRLHTLRQYGDSSRCPNCAYHASVDAEGNFYINGKVVSNNGMTIEKIKERYLDEDF